MSKATVWSRLKAKGFTDTACAAIMGNMWQESKFIPNNVEDRCHRDTGWSDEQYTAMVDSGSYTREQFMRDPDPSTGMPRAYGYGLCQWTYYTRKIALYDLAKGRGVSIADEQMQIDLLCQELQTDYRSVYDVLMSGASLYDMTEKFMRTFENPADQSERAIKYRVSCAQAIYNELAGSTPEPAPEPPQPPEPDTPTTPFWPPRMLCEGMVGADVAALQGLLLAHGCNVPLSGEFDNKTKAMVMAFQGESGLATDGIAGPKTFHALGVNV